MNQETLVYSIDNKEVIVEIIRTNNKNMYLKIKGDKLIASAPKGIPLKRINSFISKHINRFSMHLDNQKANVKYSFKNKFVFLLGQKYDIEIMKGFKRRSYEVGQGIIFLNLKEGTKVETDAFVKKFLKELVTERIIEIQRLWEKEMEIPKHSISVVYKTSTWGTNILSKRKISYSARLAHYDEKALHYLAIHELAHYNVANHSKYFWDNVRLYMPNYKEVQKILKDDATLKED